MNYQEFLFISLYHGIKNPTEEYDTLFDKVYDLYKEWLLLDEEDNDIGMYESMEEFIKEPRKSPIAIMHSVLTAHEFFRFSKNIYKSDMKRLKDMSPAGIILHGFPWDNAPEGKSYWSNIYERLNKQ